MKNLFLGLSIYFIMTFLMVFVTNLIFNQKIELKNGVNFNKGTFGIVTTGISSIVYTKDDIIDIVNKDLNVDYNVVFEDFEDDKYSGSCVIGETMIKINKGLTKTVFIHTYIHECIHLKYECYDETETEMRTFLFLKKNRFKNIMYYYGYSSLLTANSLGLRNGEYNINQYL